MSRVLALRIRAFTRTASALLLMAAISALASQTDARLQALFEQLRDAQSADDARVLETRIWGIWNESGDDDVDRLMQAAVRAMAGRRYEQALEHLDQVVRLAPQFAEGWNRRATVYWLLDRLSESVADIQRTLALEPRHFGAISGMGLIFMQSGDEEGALDAFEALLVINPHAAGARQRVEVLRQSLRDRQI